MSDLIPREPFTIEELEKRLAKRLDRPPWPQVFATLLFIMKKQARIEARLRLIGRSRRYR